VVFLWAEDLLDQIVCSLQLSVRILFTPNLVRSSSHDITAMSLSRLWETLWRLSVDSISGDGRMRFGSLSGLAGEDMPAVGGSERIYRILPWAGHAIYIRFQVSCRDKGCTQTPLQQLQDFNCPKKTARFFSKKNCKILICVMEWNLPMCMCNVLGWQLAAGSWLARN